MKYYVYEMRDMIKNVPFYVGKGTGKRTYAHTSKSSLDKNDGNMFKKNVIRKMLSENNKPGVKYVFRTDDELVAYAEETKLILQYGRRDLGTGILTNLTNGGVGSLSPNAETRYKMGSSRRGKKESTEETLKRTVGLIGFIHTEDSRKNMSNARAGKTWNEIYGIDVADILRDNASSRSKAHTHSTETKQKMSNSKIGKKKGPMSMEQKAKISVSVKNTVLLPEAYNRMILSTKGKSRKYNPDGSWVMVKADTL